MTAAGQSILTINGGSSSIKFALFTAEGSPALQLRGQIATIGAPGATLSVQGEGGAGPFTQPVAVPDHAAAVEVLMHWVEAREAHGKRGEHRMAGPLIAVGHRVVHGGPDLHMPQAVTAAMLEQLRELIPRDPAHLPSEIALIEAFDRRFPQLPQIACFDTAFHHDLPPVARLLPIPRRYLAQGVRRYGFHGLSYEFLMDELRRIGDGADKPAAHGRVILAHLGNGASLAAVRDGKPVDTSMGFTPAAGVMMGTRSGDLDPGIAAHLARSEGMDAEQFNRMVHHQSGLLGISETSGDMRELLRRETEDPRAAEAVAMFCYQVRKCIGGFAAALGGLDTLVFAGGIGEQAAPVRMRICAGLGFLGITLDALRNAAHAPLISADGATVKVRVMRTDEERVIARAVCRLLGISGHGAADGRNPS